MLQAGTGPKPTAADMVKVNYRGTLIDGKELQKQLIAAYLLGMPVHKDDFLFIPPCDEADQTNCFTGWRTFKKGYEPTWKEREVIVTNPLSWTRNAEYMSATSNPGTSRPRAHD